jgi:hypothetical protein
MWRKAAATYTVINLQKTTAQKPYDSAVFILFSAYSGGRCFCAILLLDLCMSLE